MMGECHDRECGDGAEDFQEWLFHTLKTFFWVTV
jgi:hypothetical protein